MIELMRIQRTEKFFARLKFDFIGSNKTDLLDIMHDPSLDPPRIWTAKKPDELTIKIRCEVRLFGPTGEIISLELVTSNTPITILADCKGLTITASGKP